MIKKRNQFRSKVRCYSEASTAGRYKMASTRETEKKRGKGGETYYLNSRSHIGVLGK